MPHDHQHVLGRVPPGRRRPRSQRAIAAAADARREWAALLVGGRARRSSCEPPSCSPGRGATTLNAATMLGQSKTAFQAEIDCRLRADRLLALQRRTTRSELYQRAADQLARACGTGSSTAPLEGFVFAVTPFNFTAIGGNLPTAPALMGNTVVWKPASTRDAARRDYMHAAARGGGAARPASSTSCPARRAQISDPVLAIAAISPASTSPARPRCLPAVCGRQSGRRSPSTAPYPRIVGETGGKNFVLAHPLAAPATYATAPRPRLLRVPGAEVLGGLPAPTYPRSLWPAGTARSTYSGR